MAPSDSTMRRVRITLRKPWFALYGFVRPTLVIAGRGQPSQWGTGTWQMPAGESVRVAVFLFNRIWRFGRAEVVLEPDHAPEFEYRAPALPFLSGRISARPTTAR
ncbi:hypothetical protein Q9R19_01095 [Microbacterium sp. ARD32]|uniref:hypothetical protein n=1 Tax=Microbacterium sp. ARD32 TaxID=2962577 RepID=UPI002881ADB9|nr:hypothetical protein [Microbacterium sp. ARD32]MDT0156212.1 hypothetical protein [Microbacterium sp. ARD32]